MRNLLLGVLTAFVLATERDAGMFRVWAYRSSKRFETFNVGKRNHGLRSALLRAAKRRWDSESGDRNNETLVAGGKLYVASYAGCHGDSLRCGCISGHLPIIRIFYSAQILLFGGELTHVCAFKYGSRKGMDL
jgi:hypothetical protein